MNELPSPATGVELYLAAVHGVLCDIRMALVDRGLVRLVDERIDEALGEVASAVHYAAEPAPPAVKPTKRTRARTPRTT